MPAKYLSKNHNFDPLLIVSQISLIFSLFYVLHIFFTILFNNFFGLKMHIYQILSSDVLDFESSYGLAYMSTLFFTYLFMTATYIVVVDRANKILDYILTNFLIHLILTTLTSHFPLYLFWWLLHGVYIIVVTLVSEYVSLRLDQRGIKLNFNLEAEKKI